MKAETVDDLLKWTRDTHGFLARRLDRHANRQTQTRTEMLMHYLAEHESALERMVAEYEGRADLGTLGTWVYDYSSEYPLEINVLDDDVSSNLSVDDISATVFGVHQQLIELYRYLMGRADTPELRELISELLDLEQHEAMRLAQQVDRLKDL